MGSARDRYRDPSRASGPASPPRPNRSYPQPVSSTGSAVPPQRRGAATALPGRTSIRLHVPLSGSFTIQPLSRQHKLRVRRYGPQSEQSYRHWVKRLIFFHHVRHPTEGAEPEIKAFLTHLAMQENVSASTQNQASSTLWFLYRYVLGRPIGGRGDVGRARRPKRLPVVITRAKGEAVLEHLTSAKGLMASPLHGAGLRRLECLRLRGQPEAMRRTQAVSPTFSKGPRARKSAEQSLTGAAASRPQAAGR